LICEATGLLVCTGCFFSDTGELVGAGMALKTGDVIAGDETGDEIAGGITDDGKGELTGRDGSTG